MRASRVVVLNLVTVAVLLAGLELGSRRLAPTGFPDPVIAGRNELWTGTRDYDPDLFWVMRPHGTYQGRPLTNTRGYRGPDFGPKGSAEYRILSLGESTTFAGKIPYRECYSARLERSLGPVGGRHPRVINAGVPAYSLFQGMTWLRREGEALRPDAVLIYFGFNDFLPVADRVDRDAGADAATSGFTDRELHAARQGWRTRVTWTLQRHSNLVRWLSFRDAAGGAGSAAAALPRTESPRVPEEDRRALLAEMRAWCEERGVRLVVIIPWYRTFDDHVPLLRELRSEPDGAFLVVDLPAVLPRDSAEHFRDTIHPTASGHAEIARVLTEALHTGWPDAGR